MERWAQNEIDNFKQEKNDPKRFDKVGVFEQRDAGEEDANRLYL